MSQPDRDEVQSLVTFCASRRVFLLTVVPGGPTSRAAKPPNTASVVDGLCKSTGAEPFQTAQFTLLPKHDKKVKPCFPSCNNQAPLTKTPVTVQCPFLKLDRTKKPSHSTCRKHSQIDPLQNLEAVSYYCSITRCIKNVDNVWYNV